MTTEKKNTNSGTARKPASREMPLVAWALSGSPLSDDERKMARKIQSYCDLVLGETDDPDAGPLEVPLAPLRLRRAHAAIFGKAETYELAPRRARVGETVARFLSALRSYEGDELRAALRVMLDTLATEADDDTFAGLVVNHRDVAVIGREALGAFTVGAWFVLRAGALGEEACPTLHYANDRKKIDKLARDLRDAAPARSAARKLRRRPT